MGVGKLLKDTRFVIHLEKLAEDEERIPLFK